MSRRKIRRLILCAVSIISVFTIHLIHFKEENESPSDTTTTVTSATYIQLTSEAETEAGQTAVGSAATRQTETQRAADERQHFKSAAFYNIDTDEILSEYNLRSKIAPASLTKILTACVALHYTDPQTEFRVGTELSLLNPRSSLCLISKGHRLTLSDLIKGLLMASGNDAAYTIAVNVARNVSKNELTDKAAVEYFCKLMNEFAQSIGMTDSNFTSPDGWDDDNQYSTVEDLLTLTRYACGIEVISETVSTKEKYVVFASGQNVTWKNSNQLLHSDNKHYNEYAVGMKTGTTADAGNCLIALFNKNGNTYIGIICGAETSDLRYSEMNRIFEEYT